MNAGDIGAHAFGIAVITCMCSRRTPSLTLRSEGCVRLTKVCAELRRTTSNRAKTDASRSISCISGLHLVTFFACATFFPFWQPPPARLLRHITTGNRKHVLPVSVSDHRAENSQDTRPDTTTMQCDDGGAIRNATRFVEMRYGRALSHHSNFRDARPRTELPRSDSENPIRSSTAPDPVISHGQAGRAGHGERPIQG